MHHRSRALCCLDTIYLLITLPLVCLSIYLLASSISFKLSDCSGFYTNCLHTEKAFDQIDDKPITTATTTTITNRDKQSSRRRLVIDFQAKSGIDIRREFTRAQSSRNYDWIILDQYAILISFVCVIIFGFVSVFRSNRKLVLVSILLYLVVLIQLTLIEASDDRDFPENIFRHGYSVAHYSILYLDATTRSLVLKIIFLLLIFFEFTALLFYFVLLRYNQIYLYQIERPASEANEVVAADNSTLTDWEPSD